MHSPAWSQMAQSTGWFRSRNSITARWLSWTRALLVWMTIPSAIGVWQAGDELGRVAHLDQAHAAVGRDAQARVVAVVGDVGADLLDRVHHVGAGLGDQLLAVHRAR